MTEEEWAHWKAVVRPGKAAVTYLQADILDGVERSFNWGQVQSLMLQRAAIGALARGLRIRFQSLVQEKRKGARR